MTKSVTPINSIAGASQPNAKDNVSSGTENTKMQSIISNASTLKQVSDEEHYLFLSDVTSSQKTEGQAEHEKEAELDKIRELLGAEKYSLQINSKKKDLIASFSKHVLEQFGPLDYGGILLSHHFTSFNKADTNEKRIARICEASGVGFVGKCPSYLNAYKSRLCRESLVLFMSILCRKIELLVKQNALSTNDLKLFKEYLFNSLFVSASNDKKDSYVWARDKFLNSEADEYLQYICEGQEMLYRTIEAGQVLQGIDNFQGNSIVKNLLLMIKNNPSNLIALEELARLNNISALDTSYRFVPNRLSLKLQEVQSIVRKKIDQEQSYFECLRWLKLGRKEKDILQLSVANEYNYNCFTVNSAFEEMLNQVKLITSDVSSEAFKKEKAIVDVLVMKGRREMIKTTGKVVSAVSGVGALLGGGYYAISKITNSGQSGKAAKVRELQNRIQLVTNQSENINWREQFETAQRISRAEMTGLQFNVENKIGEDLAREWNKIFRILAAYLEPEPSDSLVRQEIDTFLKGQANFRNLIPASNTEDTRRFNEMIELLSNYFNRNINKENLAEGISELHIGVKRFLGDICRALGSRYALQRNQVTGLPENMVRNLTDDLRFLGDDWFKPLPESRWTPVQVVGSEVMLVDTAKGKMLQVLTAGDNMIGLPFFRNYTERLGVVRCWSRLHNMVQNQLISYFGILRNEIRGLHDLNIRIDESSNLEEVERSVQSAEDKTQKLTTVLIPSYARCLNVFQMVEDVNEIRQIIERAGLQAPALPSFS